MCQVHNSRRHEKGGITCVSGWWGRWCWLSWCNHSCGQGRILCNMGWWYVIGSSIVDAQRWRHVLCIFVHGHSCRILGLWLRGSRCIGCVDWVVNRFFVLFERLENLIKLEHGLAWMSCQWWYCHQVCPDCLACQNSFMGFSYCYNIWTIIRLDCKCQIVARIWQILEALGNMWQGVNVTNVLSRVRERKIHPVCGH